MKKKLTYILIFSVFIPFCSNAQNFTPELDSVYQNTANALGGKEKWEKIKSLYAEGKWSQPHGEEIAFIFKSMDPDLSRVDFIFEGKLHSYSNFGHRGWVKDPAYLLSDYEASAEIRKRTSRNAFMYTNNLVDYEKKGLSLEFEGSVFTEDEEFSLIRVEGFKDKEELYFISAENSLPVIKQSYYFLKDRNGVVNYHIREYMSTEGVQVPAEVLVSTDDLNLKFQYSSYVLNYDMNRSDFRDPSQPDYTTNILSFSKEEAQEYLNSEIPITRAMGIEVQTLSNNNIEMKAPIALNANHFNSAFGGSVDSLFLTAGWAFLRLITDHIEPAPLIVGRKAETTFQRPILDDFVAKLVIPTKKETDDFLEALENFGKARIKLKAEIKEGNRMYATFTGSYVVVKDQQHLKRN